MLAFHRTRYRLDEREHDALGEAQEPVRVAFLFGEFCEKHLSHLDEVALEFFATDRAKEIFRTKVAALYPAHEVERFTEHFWGLVGFWRKTEADRLAARPAAAPKTKTRKDKA